jgi:hypothetical protein
MAVSSTYLLPKLSSDNGLSGFLTLDLPLGTSHEPGEGMFESLSSVGPGGLRPRLPDLRAPREGRLGERSSDARAI